MACERYRLLAKVNESSRVQNSYVRFGFTLFHFEACSYSRADILC
jgi:hypothetical protein